MPESVLMRGIRTFLWRAYVRLRIPPIPERSLRKLAPVFVLFSARSGSKLLISSLNHLDGVHIRYEILNPQFLRSPFLRKLFGDAAMRFSTKASAMRYIAHVLRKSGGDTYGAKLQFSQLRRAGITVHDLMRYFPQCKCILVYRRSMSEQYVSLLIAEKTQRWGHAMNDETYVPFAGTVHISPASLGTYYDEMRASYAAMLSLKKEFPSHMILVAYEDMRDDLQAELQQRICPFLQREYTPVQPDFLRQKNYELRDVIDNFSDVHHLLTGPQSEL